MRSCILIAITACIVAVSSKAQIITNWPGADTRFGIGLNSQTHKLVEAIDLSVPVTDWLGASMVGARIGSSVSYGGGALTLGGSWDAPLVGSVRLFTGDGVVYDGAHGVANYAFAGAEKTWLIKKTITVGAGFTTANISTQPGVDVLIGGSISWRPKNW